MTDGPQSAVERRLHRDVAAALEALGEPAGDDDVARYARLLAELERWNRRINLTAVRDPQDMIARHLLDSLVARPLLHGPRVLDVGTGPGFPGLPLAVAERERQFTLLDSNGKKISFVRHMIGDLGLANAEAVQARVEAFAPAMPYDTVVARAFAPLPRLVAAAGHLVAAGGVLLALKGKHPDEELAELGESDRSWNADVTELDIPGLVDHDRHAVRLTRRAAEGP